MAAPILNALTSGFTQKQIIDFIIKKFPEHKDKIESAIKMGFTPDKIIKYLTGGRKAINQQEQFQQQQQPQQQSMTEHEQTVASEQQRKSHLNQTAIGVGTSLIGAPLGAYALSRALPKIAQTLAPQIMQGGILPPPTTSGAQIPPPQPGAPQAQQAGPTPSNPQLQQAQLKAPQDALWDKVQSGDIDVEGKKDDFLLAARGIRKQGGLQTKEEFDKFFQDYMANKDKYRGPDLVNFLRNQFKQGYEKVEPKKSQEKAPTTQPELETFGNLALLPKGDVGTIESIKNGIARVNVDGKITNRKLDDLQDLSISQPDLADLYENLIKAIPEHARSSVINFAGYDAAANELIFRPHSGAAYVYKDIPPEFADKLKNAMFQAKTTGENFYGSWAAGEGSRFAGLGALIRELQKLYGGKGKEYVRKYETLVDILGEPEKAKKEKYKRMREDEKKRKKQKPAS